MGFWYTRFHDFRHTCATMAISNGMDAEPSSSIIGYVFSATTSSSAAMTRRM